MSRQMIFLKYSAICYCLFVAILFPTSLIGRHFNMADTKPHLKPRPVSCFFFTFFCLCFSFSLNLSFCFCLFVFPFSLSCLFALKLSIIASALLFLYQPRFLFYYYFFLTSPSLSLNANFICVFILNWVSHLAFSVSQFTPSFSFSF